MPTTPDHRSPLAYPRNRRARITVHRFWRWLAGGIAVVALLGAILWSLAYVNGVYNDTHPWIKASRWIYANIPDGSTIAWELWDDSLPYDLPEPNSSRGRYRFIDWGPFEEDTAEKFEWLKSTLREADVLALSSNRIYGAVDNLPERYPMTNRYYQLLFDGQLGYELALEQVNSPQLFGVTIDDRNADESFTLYDHPRVLVFRKVRDLSDAEWDALLGGSWVGAQPWYVGQETFLQSIWPSSVDRAGARGPKPEPQPGEGKSLLLDGPVRELPVVQDFRWNTLASRSTPLAVLTWWLAISLLGWAAWPITFGLFRNLHDRGYLLSRSLGWLLVGWLAWIGASLRIVQFRTPVVVVALGLVALASLLLWRRQRPAMAQFWREQKRLVLGGEALFAAAFLLFVLFRIANPDIWQPWNGGEKFMEFAFLNAILRSPYFPPLDPYFAGGVINYYYYGYFLVAILIKLTGIASSVAFNLAIPTVFALAVVNVWSLAYNLALRLWPAPSGPPLPPLEVRASSPLPQGEGLGVRVNRSRPAALTALLAAFFVAMLGNVDGGGQIVRKLAALSSSSFESNLPGVQTAVRAVGGLAKVIGPERLPGYNYWDPSRVIPNTINEFPYWSFLFADLHPHMIGIGFTVLFLALAWSVLIRNGARLAPAVSDGWRPWTVYVVRAATGDGLYVALALVLGALAVINTWDLPTYFGLAVLIWLMREWRSGRMTSSPAQAIVRTALFAAALVLTALLFYLPFFANYHALASSGVGLVPQSSELGKWLNMWGFLGFMALSLVLVELRRRGSRYRPFGDAYLTHRAVRDPLLLRWLRLASDHFGQLARLVQLTPHVSANSLLVIGVAVAAAVALMIVDRTVAGVLLLPLLAAFLLLWRRTVPAEALFMMALVFTGLLVLFGVEIFYLKDHLQGGDWRRMNTLFKFYIQVWVMLALATAVALPGIWDFIRRRWRPVWRALWLVGFVCLLALSLVFLVVGTPVRLDDRFPEGFGGANRPPLGTLDGMAYMQAGTYTWHPDSAQAPTSRIELRHDYDALRWMLDTIEGTPVVAEALIGYYREGGLRVASFTGFPTLLGFHQEGEQRYGWQTGPRRSQAEEFWRTTDLGEAQQLMAELGIDYIYLGQLERIVYPVEGLAKFERMAEDGLLEVVYSNEQVTIYQVVQ
jgi:YYY domain-containing protein